MRSIKYIIIHCSATPEGRDVGIEEVRQWHLNRGWNDIGYHYFIELDGQCKPGRPEDIAGAHAYGYNQDSLGVCYAGGVDADMKPKDTRTECQKDQLLSLLKYLKEKYPKAQIIGHRDVSNKACPSFDAKSEYSLL